MIYVIDLKKKLNCFKVLVNICIKMYKIIYDKLWENLIIWRKLFEYNIYIKEELVYFV